VSRYLPENDDVKALVAAVVDARADAVKICWVVAFQKSKKVVIPKGLAVVMAKQKSLVPQKKLMLLLKPQEP